MIFNEDIVLRSNRFEGNNLTRLSTGYPLALCRFGPSQSQSLIAIARTLDRLLVYELDSLLINRSLDSTSESDDQQEDADKIQVISIKDQVISTVEVVRSDTANGQDVLLIGCAQSIMIYATRDQTHLSSVNTSARLTAISSIQLVPLLSQDLLSANTTVLACAGVQKLYTYQLLTGDDEKSVTGQEESRFHPVLELSSERTMSESINCLACGTHDQIGACLVTGSREHKIRVYPIDALDRNIQTARLTLDETSPVSCLCPIETLHSTATGDENASQAPNLQMNHLAYGLENGTIGVYHLLTMLNDDDENERDKVSNGEQQYGRNRSQVMMGERLWRHKSKQTPVSLVMFDANGDGLDELIVGYRNGRLEVRSPFTGQLLAASRLFSGGGAQLVGLLTWPLELHGESSASKAPPGGGGGNELTNSQLAHRSRQALLACSSTSLLVAIRPRQKRPREPLRDYLARSGRNLRVMPSSTEQPDRADQVLVEEHARELAGTSEPLKLEIETRGDNLRPVASESRQSAQLMQKIGALSNEQDKQGARLGELYRDWVARRQVVNKRKSLKTQSELETHVHITHSWDFDSVRQKLRLTLQVETSLKAVSIAQVQRMTIDPPPAAPEAIIDMIELVDVDSCETFEPGCHYQQQLLIRDSPHAATSSTHKTVELWLNANATGDGSTKSGRTTNAPLRLQVRVFYRLPKQRKTSQKLYEQLVELGPYATFVPMSQFGATGNDAEPPILTELKVTLTFRLPDRVHRLQALDWLQTNFLCFHYGQVHGNTESRRGSRSPNSDHYQDSPIENDMQRFSVESIGVGGRGTSGCGVVVNDNGELQELRFVDLRRLRRQQVSGPKVECHLHIRLSVSDDQTTDELAIETDDLDLLVELVKSLVLGRLQLSMQNHLLVLRDHGTQSGLEPMTLKLGSLIKNSRQLEESENRIQTEIYESAELIKQLMQQFAIACQLNEFATSTELLGEIFMMLDRTQNSAQSFQLNSRSRQELTREATCLREKISFLTGGGGGGDFSGLVSSAMAIS